MSILPKLAIETPKMVVSGESIDLSDHFPIAMTLDDKKIISYNVQLMHRFLTKPKITAEQRQTTIQAIAEYFDKSNASICCVQELFDKKANLELEEAMSARGYFATKRLDRNTPISMFNGGVRCFVRNIDKASLETRLYFYDHKIDYLIGGDATANKGAEHISFISKGKKYHVINTHLQAYYPKREHYAEITLAQCVELKQFIEKQRKNGIIGPDDQVILCGDFNIPKPHENEEETQLFTKMKHILGPSFIALDYADSNNHTRSRSNTHNLNEPESSDNDVNLDLSILCDPNPKNNQIAAVLSDIYSEIQLSLATFVSKKSTLFSYWLLFDAEKEKLTRMNQSFMKIIKQAEVLQQNGKNPLESRRWVIKTERLRLELYQATHQNTFSQRNVGGVAISAGLLFVLPPAAFFYALLSLAYFAIMIFFGMLKSEEPLQPITAHPERFFTPKQKQLKEEQPSLKIIKTECVA